MTSDRKKRIINLLPSEENEALSVEAIAQKLSVREDYAAPILTTMVLHPTSNEELRVKRKKVNRMYRYWKLIDTTPEDSAYKALQGLASIFGREEIDSTPEITPRETSLSVTRPREISIDTIEEVLSNSPDPWLSARQILEKLGYNLYTSDIVNKVTGILKHLRHLGIIDRQRPSVVNNRLHLLYRYSVLQKKGVDVVTRGSPYIERIERIKDKILELLPSNEQEGMTKEEIINHIDGEEERDIGSALMQLQQHGEITEKGLKYWSTYNVFYNWRIRRVKRDILATLPFEREKAMPPQEVANPLDFYIQNDNGTAYIDNERYLHHCIEVIDALEELYHSHEVDKYYWHGGRYRYWRIKRGEQQMLEDSRSVNGVEDTKKDKIMGDTKIHKREMCDHNVLEVQVGTNIPCEEHEKYGGKTIFMW